MNKKQISVAVESELKRYKFYLLTTPEDQMPKFTSEFKLLMPALTDEDISDFERERHEYLNRIVQAINRLTKKSRELIIQKHFKEEDIFDYEVYSNLGLSEWYYHQRAKPKAYRDFAISLGIFKPSFQTMG
ncbi:ArpU family transcriptional regulator [Bacillus idriensis]|uniref:ArpU family transcriptional regulator n=1 Tax=Metabacillus idriensis TaxID=324768 RepID=A0A6I2MLI6_9BACI|nr:ArpU family phage packaging/lysis transcriptional regulator [Metabacillus idriensis]MRX56723.1 ArpU family transcriptional regulator [Metabacillus idriensis]